MTATRRAGTFLAVTAGVAAAYAVVGFAFLMLGSFGASAPLWPPAGLAFAAVLVWRAKAAPGILLGSLIANTAYLTANGAETIPVLTATVIGTGAAIQALVAAALVRRFLDRPAPLASARDIGLFLLLAGPVASTINATIGTATQVAADVIPADGAGLAWLIWWAGDAMGVIVFGPIALMFLPDPSGLWHGWRFKVGPPSAIVAAVLMAAIMASVNAEHQQLDIQRAQAARDANALLLNQLDREGEVLQGIRDLLYASQDVSAREFRQFTRDSLERFGSLQALSWNTSLTYDELPEFLAQRRAQPGGADFQATERNSEGQLRPVRPGRDQYVVVTYIEPLADNRQALGFDIASNPARKQTIDRAQATGLISATPPIDLVQSGGDTQKGMLVLNPVYRASRTPITQEQRLARIRGFSVGVYEIGEMVDEVFTSEVDPAKWDSVNIELVDVTDPAAPVTLAERGTDAVVTTSVTVVGEPLRIWGRTWQLSLTPTSGPLSQPSLGASPYLLLAALIGLYLLEVLLILLAGRERQAQEEASQRTYEANHDALTHLLNRRGFLTRLEQVCDDATNGSAASVLLFCDLDRFKYVNDAAGHAAGDRMLIAVAGLLRRNVRQADVVARMGGDEFAVILVDCPLDKALAIASSIEEAVRDFRLPTAAGDQCVTISIGATSMGGQRPLTPDEALRESDAASYIAKQSGSGGVRVFAGDSGATTSPNL